jgi:outer membrane protein W
MLSVFGGPTLMLTDFNKEKVGWGVEYFPHYGFSQHVSLGFLVGYNDLKTEQSSPVKTPSYSYLKVDAIPLTIIGSWYFTSNGPLSPFVYAGGGMVLAIQRDEQGKYISERHIQVYGLFPLGAGLEFFLNKNLSLGFDLGVRIFGSDNVEGMRRGLPDACMLGRISVNLYHVEAD